MIVEMRRRELGVPTLILIPNQEEVKLVEEVLGRRIQTDNGLISQVEGEVRLADGYGPLYISLQLKKSSE
jgi:hypothetical protein